MTRRSLVDRYTGKIDRQADELAGIDALAGLSPVHVQTVDVLTELLAMGERFSDKDTPAMMRTMLTMMQRTRPLMLEQLRNVPPGVIVEFMRELCAKMQSIIDKEGADSDRSPAGAPAAGTGHAGADIATSA